MSDPAAKENRAMAQTVHPLDFQLFDFQQLSVMEVSFLLPEISNLNPTNSCFREGHPSGLSVSLAWGNVARRYSLLNERACVLHDGHIAR
jgi:hypothetical protein